MSLHHSGTSFTHSLLPPCLSLSLNQPLSPLQFGFAIRLNELTRGAVHFGRRRRCCCFGLGWLDEKVFALQRPPFLAACDVCVCKLTREKLGSISLLETYPSLT